MTTRQIKQPKFKSKFENLIWNTLKDRGVTFLEYEPDKFDYVIPASQHRYNPDFKIRDKVYIETKGLFSYADRTKMKLVKEAHPDITIYLCFMNANLTLGKKSKTTYADWADKHGFQWCHAPSGIPEEWLKPERLTKKRVRNVSKHN